MAEEWQIKLYRRKKKDLYTDKWYEKKVKL